MNTPQGLPEVPLDYIALLNKSFENYRRVTSHEDFEMMIGRGKILNVSHFPQYVVMSSLDPLPPEFKERIYHFRDETGGNGVMDATFEGTSLVNIRAQLFFEGFAAKRKAKKYLYNPLLPAFRLLFGLPNEDDPNGIIFTFRSKGIKGTATYLRGTLSVSFYLVDEKY